MKRSLLVVGMSSLLLGGAVSPSVFADPAQAAPVPSESDNTAVNKVDRNPSEPTADQGGNKKTDIETTRSIRKAIVADGSLSTYAHNVKIIAQDGRVTLKGTVHTESEKEKIAAKATAIAGAENVVNKINVKGS
jgi:hyperosmotically inducible protein